jgi:nucleotide-binding universal stress UspA family protein
MATARVHHGIVVGVDGSAASKVAVDWAARAASMRNVPLALVHVIPSPTVWKSSLVPMPSEAAAHFDKTRHDIGREILRDARAVVAQATDHPYAIALEAEAITGNALPTLIELSKQADMIVVGCRGLSAIGRRLLGSVSWGLVKHSSCPVAIIHDEDPLMPTPAVAPVVVGIDGSPASEFATAIAFAEASRRGVELVAVHAWSDFGVDEIPGVEWSDVQRLAEEALAERLAGWQEHYPDVAVRRVVVLGRPAPQLLKESESAQLTVVGSHGRGGFAGMLLGSVSATVAESARMPVIVARPS